MEATLSAVFFLCYAESCGAACSPVAGKNDSDSQGCNIKALVVSAPWV